MALARLEMTVTLEQMLERFPHFGLAGEPQDSGMIFGHHRGWNKVPLALGA
jgi:cytochrome P450